MQGENLKLQNLKARLESFAISKELAINQAVNDVAKERDQLKNGLDRLELQKQLSEKALRDKYETQIKDRDEAIERLRDMKARLSTKMLGETQNNTVRQLLIVYEQQRFLVHILKRTMIHVQEAKETIFSEIQTMLVPKSSPLCLR